MPLTHAEPADSGERSTGVLASHDGDRVDPSISDFLILFSSVLWEAMPFIVLGALVAGILEEFLPQQAHHEVLAESRAARR